MAELNSATVKPYYAGPKDAAGNITAQLLFRGPFPSEEVGPYISQLWLLPAQFGALAVEQKYGIVAPGFGPFMTTTPASSCSGWPRPAASRLWRGRSMK